MDAGSELNGSQKTPGRLVLPTLFITRFVMGTPGIVSGLLLIEMGASFGTPVGITGQIRTASSIMGVVAALVIGALSVRFDHKSLLLTGVVLYLVSSLGCSFAVSFGMLMLFYTLNGMAFSIVSPMSSTLVAEYFSLERRTMAIGWLIAGGSSAFVIGAQVIALIADVGGWRSAFLWFMFPVASLGLLMARFFLPSVERHRTPDSVSYLGGFRAILSQRSAASCLAGTALRSASFQVVLLYSTSMMRQLFSFSRGTASVFMTISALCYTVGSIVAGRFVQNIGRKRMTVLATFLAALFTIVFTMSGDLWMALATNFLSAWFYGTSVSSGQSLNLEQVPSFRGTMMSLNSASGSIGGALGAGLGGLMILQYGYGVLGVALGLVGIVAGGILHFFVSDPTRT